MPSSFLIQDGWNFNQVWILSFWKRPLYSPTKPLRNISVEFQVRKIILSSIALLPWLGSFCCYSNDLYFYNVCVHFTQKNETCKQDYHTYYLPTYLKPTYLTKAHMGYSIKLQTLLKLPFGHNIQNFRHFCGNLCSKFGCN